jgi:hypothetical protein
MSVFSVGASVHARAFASLDLQLPDAMINRTSDDARACIKNPYFLAIDRMYPTRSLTCSGFKLFL